MPRPAYHPNPAPGFDPRPRLAAIEAVELDGAAWWRLDEFCMALRCDPARASPKAPADHKRYAWFVGRRMVKRLADLPRGIQAYRLCLIDRAAAETLLIRYSTIPVNEAMEALCERPA